MPDDASPSPPKITDLCAVLALALNLQRKWIDSYASYLRREGLLPATVGGRGNTGGAVATAKEAAVLLVGLLASDEALNVADGVRRFAPLTLSGFEMRGADGYVRLEPPETFSEWRLLHGPFLEVVEALIRAYHFGTIPADNGPVVRVGITRTGAYPGGWIELRCPKDDGSYLSAAAVYRVSEGPKQDRPSFAIDRTAALAPEVLLVVGCALMPAEEGGLRALHEEADDLQQEVR